MRLLAPSFVAASSWALFSLIACSDAKPDSESTNGGSGGSTGAGTNTGGVTSAGGPANTAGASVSGGVANTGGATVTGGAAPTGGTSTLATGGATVQSGASSGGKAAGGGGSSSTTGGAATTGGSSGEVYPPTFTTVRAILASNEGMCAAAPCHSSLGRLSLTDNANLLMRMTSFMSEACGMPFITPGNPEMSAFVKILKGPCGETPQMPYDCIPGMFGTCLPDDYVAVIEQWITNGAKND